MQATPLTQTSIQSEVVFHLSQAWLQSEGFAEISLQKPHIQQWEPAMTKAVSDWLRQSEQTLWEAPVFEKIQTESEKLSFQARIPAIATPHLLKPETIKLDVPETLAQPGLLETVAELQQELADTQKVNGPAEWGMRMTVDTIGFVNGIPIPDSAQEAVQLQLTPALLYPDFGRQLLGLRPGQAKDVAVILPADFPIESWCGQKAIYKIKLHELERLRLPRLDDTLALRANRGKTLRELEAHLLAEQEVERRLNWNRQLADTALNAVMQSIVLPSELVDAQMQVIWEQTLVPALKKRNVLPLQLAKAQPFWQQHRVYRQTSEQNLKLGLTYQLLLESFGLQLSSKELDVYLAPLAERFGKDEDTIRAELSAAGQLQAVIQELLRRKAEKELLRRVNFDVWEEEIA